MHTSRGDRPQQIRLQVPNQRAARCATCMPSSLEAHRLMHACRQLATPPSASIPASRSHLDCAPRATLSGGRSASAPAEAHASSSSRGDQSGDGIERCDIEPDTASHAHAPTRVSLTSRGLADVAREPTSTSCSGGFRGGPRVGFRRVESATGRHSPVQPVRAVGTLAQRIPLFALSAPAALSFSAAPVVGRARWPSGPATTKSRRG
jgi:hypothetical protein